MSSKKGVDRRSFVAAMTAAGAGVLAAAATPTAATAAAAVTADASLASDRQSRAGTPQLRLFLRISLVKSGSQLEVVTGSSNVAGFIGWIPLRSYELGFARTERDGGVWPSPPLTVVAPMGKHSQPLYNALLLNRTVAKVQLVGQYSATATWRLTELTASQVTFLGGTQSAAAGAVLPLETWSFDFLTVSGTIRPDNGSGQPEAAVTFEREWYPIV